MRAGLHPDISRVHRRRQRQPGAMPTWHAELPRELYEALSEPVAEPLTKPPAITERRVDRNAFADPLTRINLTVWLPATISCRNSERWAQLMCAIRRQSGGSRCGKPHLLWMALALPMDSQTGGKKHARISRREGKDRLHYPVVSGSSREHSDTHIPAARLHLIYFSSRGDGCELTFPAQRPGDLPARQLCVAQRCIESRESWRHAEDFEIAWVNAMVTTLAAGRGRVMDNGLIQAAVDISRRVQQ